MKTFRQKQNKSPFMKGRESVICVMIGLLFLLSPALSKAQLSGNYTIDPNSSAAGNYTTFAAAVSALNSNGVSGPVTFNVAAATFNESVAIYSTISGASTTNTISFIGQGIAGTILSSTGQPVGLQTSFISFSHMTISSSSTSSNVIGMNYSTYCSFTYCNIQGPINGSGEVVSTFGDNFCTISHNAISGDAIAVILQGYSGTSTAPYGNWTFTYNHVTHYSIYGIYAYNSSTYGDFNSNISNNVIDSTISPVSYSNGILSYFENGVTIANNQVLDHVANALQMYSPNNVDNSVQCKVYNNFFTKYTSCSIQFPASTSINLLVAHNTFYNTDGSSAFLLSLNNNSDIQVLNNVFYSVNGSGPAANYSNSGSFPPSSTIFDGNDYYNGGSGGLVSQNGMNYSNFATYQADMSSYTYTSAYTNTSSTFDASGSNQEIYILNPSSSPRLDPSQPAPVGVPVGIATDIFGNSRSSSAPTAGCAEPTVPCNISASFSVNSASQCLQGNSFSFSDASSDGSGEIGSWAWDFGDNSGTSTDENPQYSYSVAGNYTVSLTVTDGSCASTYTSTVTVNPAPSVSLGTFSDVCEGSSAFTLTGGSPNGGNYLLDGDDASSFDPSTATIGTHSVVYSYTNGSGCTATAAQSIVVDALPAVSLAGLAPQTVATTSYTLTGGSPWGGTYSGTGVSNGVFNPKSAGAGIFVITYTYTNSAGCSNSALQSIIVTSKSTDVDLTPFNNVCAGSSPFALTGGTPAGGTYSGTGVSNGVFDPSVAGAGTTKITYNYGLKSASRNIKVVALPNVTLASYANVCISRGAFMLKGGKPSCGTYSGNGVSGNKFDPAIAGVGSTTITYTYTNSTGCTSSATATITVVGTPTVSLASFNPICRNASAFTVTGGSPSGGIYSGCHTAKNGIFNPATAGVGTHTITYTVTSAGGCSASASQTITVIARPKEPKVTASGPLTICSGSIVTLATATADSYQWSNATGPILGATNQTLTVSVAGTYYVTITLNGCSNTSDGVKVKVNPIPVANIISAGDVYLGYTNCTSLTGSSSVSGSDYHWSVNVENKTIKVCPTSTSTYTLTVSAGGCTSEPATATVNVIDVRCSLPADKDDKNGEKDNDDYGVTICHNNQTICVASKDVKSYLDHGDHLGSCAAGSLAPGTENTTDNKFDVFPNPFTTNANINLVFAKDGQISLELMSIDGKRVKSIYSGIVSAGNAYNFTIEGATIVPGTYIVRLVTNDRVDYKKIEVVR